MFKCQYCGQEFKNQGSINLHERKCSKNPNRVEEHKKDVCEAGGEHEFRLLNPNKQSEKLAIHYGFKEVCIKCKGMK